MDTESFEGLPLAELVARERHRRSLSLADVAALRVAVHWADRAMEWGHEARDPIIVSYVLARKADQAATEGDAARTMGLARAAQRGLNRLPARVQAVTLLQEAHGLAIAKEEAGCHRKLDDALELASIGQRRGESGPGRYCTVEFVEIQRATCSVELGQTRRAIELFEGGLARLPSVHRRDRGVYLSRMAVAHALDREPEEASTRGLEAVRIARATGSRRITIELERLHRTLAPWRNHPSVTDSTGRCRHERGPTGRHLEVRSIVGWADRGRGWIEPVDHEPRVASRRPWAARDIRRGDGRVGDPASR